MNKVLRLIKVFLKTGNSFSTNKKKKGKKTGKWILPVLALCFLPIAIQLGKGAYAAADILTDVGMEALILYIGFISCMFFVFFFGIFYIFGVFYFAKDIEIILTLPLKPWEILTSRFVTVLLYEYLILFIILAPVLIGYGSAIGAGVIYIIYAAIIFLILPVISLTFASIPVMIIMRFTSIAKNRDKFKYIAGITALFLGVGVNFLIQKASMDFNNPDKIYQMAELQNQKIVRLGRIIPGVKYGVEALSNSQISTGLTSILLFICSAVIVYALFMTLGKSTYFKGVIGINESSSKRENITSKAITKQMNKKSILNVYVMKEIRMLMRTPIYFMNCILMNFFWPVIISIPLVIQGDFKQKIEAVQSLVEKGQYNGIIIACIFGMILFMASSNAITATAISREGKNLYIMKYLPLPLKKQIKFKIMSGFWVSAIAAISIIIIMIVLRLPLEMILLAGIMSINAMFYPALTGIIIDMKNPKLNWDNEQAAVKQNLNVLLNMVLAIAGAAV